MNKNQHIKEYLNWYIAQENPGYAVFLEWQWWSWKTHFIKEWREGLVNSKDIVYLSLYWIERISQIDSQLMMATFTELDWKWAKWSWKLKVAAKSISEWLKQYAEKKYEFDIPDIWFWELIWALDFSWKTIIFDDLERKEIELKLVMGYMNNLVEHKNANVIIIWDESRLEELKEIKEKTIWTTLHFTAEYENAIGWFIKIIKSSKIKNVLKDNRSEIDSIFGASTFNNLRILKQSLSEFERFLENFPKDLFSNFDFQRDALSIFLILSFEVKSWNIKNIEEDFPIIFERYWWEFLNSWNKTPLLKKSLLEKYPWFDSVVSKFVNKEIWTEFFQKWVISEELIVKEVSESPYLSKDPDWYKLWRFRDLEDTEFDELTKKLIEDLKSQTVENVYEVIHITCTLLHLRNIDLVDFREDDLKNDWIANIDRLRSQLNPEIKEKNNADKNSSLWCVYNWLDLESVKEFLLYYYKVSDEEQIKYQQYRWKEILGLMKENKIKEVYALFAQKYFNIPVLSEIDSIIFLDTFNWIKNERKLLLIEWIEHRFKWNFDSHKNELGFLSSLLQELEKEKEASKIKKVSSLYRDRFIEVLKKIIERITENPPLP